MIGDLDPMVNAFWETVVTDVDWLCEQVETIPLNLEEWERMKGTRFRSRRNLALACLYLNRTSFNGALHRRADRRQGPDRQLRHRLSLPSLAPGLPPAGLRRPGGPDRRGSCPGRDDYRAQGA